MKGYLLLRSDLYDDSDLEFDGAQSFSLRWRSLINKKGRLEATFIINVTSLPMSSDSMAVDNLANYL